VYQTCEHKRFFLPLPALELASTAFNFHACGVRSVGGAIRKSETRNNQQFVSTLPNQESLPLGPHCGGASLVILQLRRVRRALRRGGNPRSKLWFSNPRTTPEPLSIHLTSSPLGTIYYLSNGLTRESRRQCGCIWSLRIVSSHVCGGPRIFPCPQSCPDLDSRWRSLRRNVSPPRKPYKKDQNAKPSTCVIEFCSGPSTGFQAETISSICRPPAEDLSYIDQRAEIVHLVIMSLVASWAGVHLP